MKIYLATWLEGDQGATLTKANCKNRLISFFFLKDAPEITGPYVTTGLIVPKKRKTERATE